MCTEGMTTYSTCYRHRRFLGQNGNGCGIIRRRPEHSPFGSMRCNILGYRIQSHKLLNVLWMLCFCVRRSRCRRIRAPLCGAHRTRCSRASCMMLYDEENKQNRFVIEFGRPLYSRVQVRMFGRARVRVLDVIWNLIMGNRRHRPSPNDSTEDDDDNDTMMNFNIVSFAFWDILVISLCVFIFLFMCIIL